MLPHKFANGCVVVSPVSNHIGHTCVGERLLHLIGKQYRLFIGQTGDAPVCCHIDKYRRARGTKRFQ